MVLDFNISVFVENLKATKPPYDCPIPNCGKTYKSFLGIQSHIYNFDHENPDNNSPTPGKKPSSGKKKQKGKHWKQKMDRPSTPPDFLRPPETLTYAEAQRLVEIDLDGRIHRINIYEPLDIVTQDVIDNQSNTEKEEKGEKSPQRQVKNPEVQKGKKNPPVTNHTNSSKLPEAQYKIIEDYVKPAKIIERSDAYYRYIEKSVEELDDEVEYDMDEEVSCVLFYAYV